MRTLDYALTHEEMVYVEDVARKRNDAKDPEIRVTNSGFHKDNDDRAHPHIIGTIGEFGFAKLTNQKINEVYYKNKGDSCDFEGVEVKSTTFDDDGALLNVKIKEFNDRNKNPKYYVGCIVNKNLVKVMGCIDRSRFNKEKWIKHYDKNDCWCVSNLRLENFLPYYINGELKTDIRI